MPGANLVHRVALVFVAIFIALRHNDASGDGTYDARNDGEIVTDTNNRKSRNIYGRIVCIRNDACICYG